MKNRILMGFVLMFCCLGLAVSVQAQTDETRYSVPALDDLHEIIYPIWHTAYPQKDVAALRGYVPEVSRMAQALFDAKLPGILRDRKDKWTEGLAEFKKIVEAYVKAAESKNDQDLLNAAEALHSGFEMLNRIVRPVPQEVMDFHRSLYVVYHTYLPAKDYGRIRAAAGDLQAKAEAVLEANLSRRFESKKAEYLAAVTGLLKAVKALAGVAPASDTALLTAVETVHSRYQDLEKVFD
jgi:hypothetical protein